MTQNIKKAVRKLRSILRFGFAPVIHRARLQNTRIQKAPLDKELRSFSQNGQDHFLARLLQNKRGGYFVDIGAYDGITGSNTAFFEKELAWTGVCFEPNPIPYEILKNERHCETVNACIGLNECSVNFAAVEGPCEQLSGIVDYFSPEHKSRLESCLRQEGGSVREKTVPVLNLYRYCSERNVMSIDLLCIDVEGAEMTILRSIPFDKLHIRTIVVENNYHGDEPVGFLSTKGFTLNCMIGCDEIYLSKSAG